MNSFLRTVVTSAAVLGLTFGPHAQGQIFVNSELGGYISEYSTSGATLNASLVSGLSVPDALVLSGSDLFLGTNGSWVQEYTTSGTAIATPLLKNLTATNGIVITGSDLFVVHANNVSAFTTSGATIANPLVTGLHGNPVNIAASPTDIFVANFGSGTISEYTISGTLVNSDLITLSTPAGILVSGNELFVASSNNGTIGEYTTSGAVINASLVTGLQAPGALAFDGSNLYVVNDANSIAEYTDAGAVVNSALVTGLNSPAGLAVVAAPEPKLIALLLTGLLFGFAVIRRTSRLLSQPKLC